MAEEVQAEVDDKGVPLANRFKEFERKMEEKYAHDLEQTRKELDELKNMRQFNSQAPTQTQNFIEKNDPKEKLQRFVEDPDAYIEQRVQQRKFQDQVSEAEVWLQSKEGYSKDVRARIDALIFENKLNTPYHMPLDRARTAWKLFEAEHNAKSLDAQADENRRESTVKSLGGEGKGKNAPKDSVNIHNELIKKLAAAEAKGDMDASIKYMDMLQDHPMENSIIRGM